MLHYNHILHSVYLNCILNFQSSRRWDLLTKDVGFCNDLMECLFIVIKSLIYINAQVMMLMNIFVAWKVDVCALVMYLRWDLCELYLDRNSESVPKQANVPNVTHVACVHACLAAFWCHAQKCQNLGGVASGVDIVCRAISAKKSAKSKLTVYFLNAQSWLFQMTKFVSVCV